MLKLSASQENRKLGFDISMLDGLPNPVLLIDSEHRVVGFNRAAKHFPVTGEQNQIDENILWTRLENLIDNLDLMIAVDATLGGAPGSSREIFLDYPIARHFGVNIWRLPDLKTPGPAWVLMVFQDITESKITAQVRADFVANVSHELRSPLSALLGFVETLRGPAREDEVARERFLAIMESEAQRMTRLIDDLLTLSKVETDEHIQPEDRIEIPPLLDQVANILSVRAKERDMEIEIRLPDQVPPVLGDQDELTQVFQNLIANAINYGLAGRAIQILVDVGFEIDGKVDQVLMVSVVNEGDGIAAEELPRLTERFYRVHKGRSRTMGGTGLGLAIVKHIVARHRGHLEIESTLGKTTSFTVSLPVGPKEGY